MITTRLKHRMTIVILCLTSIFLTTMALAQISLENGEKNWIKIDDMQRNDARLTFSEVHVEHNSWLVMHPFEEGQPNGDKVVASTYLPKGTSTNVDIDVLKGIQAGEKFIVMLHQDVNDNKVLDFVFVDDTNVLDKAVFEGNTMIAHIIEAPE